MSEDFYEEIKKEYPDLFEEEKSKPSPIENKEKPMKYGRLYILPLTLMMFLMLGILSVLCFKNTKRPSVEWLAKEAVSDYLPHISNNNHMLTKFSILEDKIDSNSYEMEEIKSNLKVCKMKIHMLGTLHNENWTIYKKGKHRGNLMFVKSKDGEWYIKHMPRYIYIDPETGQYMREHYVRP